MNREDDPCETTVTPYESLGGQRHTTAAYDAVIARPCPRCLAEPGDLCTRQNGEEKPHPCLVRFH